MPKLSGEPTSVAERQPDVIYAEDYIPDGDEHHQVLGQFMNCWGATEHNFGILLCALLGCDTLRGFTIFRELSIRKASEIITALARLRLPDPMIDEMSVLTQRVSKLASKRNTLTHGIWMIEIVVWGWKGTIQIKSNLLREEVPPDARMRWKISALKNQAERIKYTHSLKRISAASRDALTLQADIGTFNKKVFARLGALPPVCKTEYQAYNPV